MILVDECRWEWRGRLWCHCVSDTSYQELHAFARSIGFPRIAFQGDHYDLDERARARAIAAGATPVSSRELVRALSGAGLRRGPAISRAGLAGLQQYPAPTLATERLLLRQWSPDDLTNPIATAIATVEEIHADATLLALRGFGRWAVQERSTGALIGRAGLRGVPFGHTYGPAIALSAALAPTSQHQGFAREACAAVLRYGFSELELDEILLFDGDDFDTVTRVFRPEDLS